MKRFEKCNVISVILVILVVLFSTAFAKEDVSEAKVLFISSYSERFNTVPEQIKGLKEVFDANKITMDIEYMDAKRFDKPEDVENFYKLLAYKINKLQPYDVIVVGDDNALQFALDYQEELFQEIPIVFLGINDFDRANLAVNRGSFSGVIEKVPLEENIELALSFNPKATKVVGIVDNTLTGIGDKRQFYNMASLFPDLIFETINSSEYTLGDVAYKLSMLEDDTIILYQSMFVDKNGVQLTIEEASAFIYKNTKVPVYRTAIGGVGEGLLGGIRVSYSDSGRVTARMVVDILNGASIENIDMIDESPKQYFFDYNIIKEYEINENLIPEDAIIINREIGFYEENKEYVLGAAILVLLLLTISVVLAIDNVKIRKAEKELMESNEELAVTYEELTAQEEELRAQYNTIGENLENIQELNKKNDKLARYDYLTNLPNRNEFSNIIKKEINKNRPFAVMLLDIDNFKKINDSLGHVYGDEILKEVANRFREIMDEKVFISRFGGDEFLILVTEEDEEEKIQVYIKKINEVFEKSFIQGMKENHLSCSIGVTLYPKDDLDLNQLMMNADTAMYKVKQNGRNNYLFYNDEMKKELKKRMDIESILREALKNDGFKLVYQPKVEVQTGIISGFEALLRLKNYNISPAYFIEIAEESDIILEISRWVTRETIQEVSKWKNKGFELKPISINFSAKQLRDLEYVQFLKEALEEYQVEAKFLEIEITENVLLENTDSTMKYLNQLRDVGTKIVLDDFGTGYSSINYLTYLSVERVKLDKSLCDRFLELNNTKVIDSIISLVHGLDMEITAEGIEKPEQYYRLREAGCDYIQGYLFSKPLDIEEIDKIYNMNMLKKLNP
ncbi:MAG: EAL domain-containing protein [Clostridiales bacterium]|nr:EAL domain-containing protein [Clostridiales bacterium]